MNYLPDLNSLELATISSTGPRWPRDYYYDLDYDYEFNDSDVEVDD